MWFVVGSGWVWFWILVAVGNLAMRSDFWGSGFVVGNNVGKK